MKTLLALSCLSLLSGCGVTTNNQSLPQPHAWTATYDAATTTGRQADSSWIDMYGW